MNKRNNSRINLQEHSVLIPWFTKFCAKQGREYEMGDVQSGVALMHISVHKSSCTKNHGSNEYSDAKSEIKSQHDMEVEEQNWPDVLPTQTLTLLFSSTEMMCGPKDIRIWTLLVCPVNTLNWKWSRKVFLILLLGLVQGSLMCSLTRNVTVHHTVWRTTIGFKSNDTLDRFWRIFEHPKPR